jgi:hypothetical protein
MNDFLLYKSLSLKTTVQLSFHFIKRILILLSATMLLASCLPEEVPLEEGSLDGDKTFNNFEGLDLVETVDGNKVKLKWSLTADSRVIAYNIYDTTLAGSPRLIKSVAKDQSEATVAGLSEGFYYKFRVRATDGFGGEDSNTNDVVGIPYSGIENAEVISSSSVRLSYADPSQGEALEGNVYCKTADDDSYQQMANVRNMTLTSVVIQNLSPNTTYTCRFAIVVDGQEDNNPKSITFTALGKAKELVFEVQPGNAAAGEVMLQQPIVRIIDENGNIVSGGPDSTALITLEVSDDSPTVGTVRGIATVAAVAGVAYFSDINFQEAGIKIVTAKKNDTSSTDFGTVAMEKDSATFNIVPGSVSPNQSTISIDPAIIPPFEGQTANGTDSYQVLITLRDEYGNPVSGTKPTFGSNYVGDFFSQPLVPSDANGETSGSISTTIADSNPARVLSITSPAGLENVQVAAPFKPGTAQKLSFLVQPTSSPAGALSMNELRVAVQDAQGNTISTGAAASSVIALSIANNTGGATLSGTTSRTAVNGVATFSDLGIDITANGYRLVASSGALSPAYSNNFNITAGIPKVISMTGPSEVLSGACSSVITLQLQDFGGNPSKAVQNTTVTLSGLGGGAFYSSSTCGGSPLGGNITFTPGTDTRSLYLKSSKVENITISGTDASAVLTPSSYNLLVTPNKMRLTAEDGMSNPLSVTAGKCSTAIRITPLADDGTDGQIFSATNVTITGITGSQAKIYSDSTCVNELNPASLPLTISGPPNIDTIFYLKDPEGEVLLMNVADPSSDISTVSLPQEVRVTASDINFSGPSTVVAGACSSVFTVTLRDTVGNDVVAAEDTGIAINGVSGVSTTGLFYTSPSCAGGGSNNLITVPNGNSAVTVYFKGLSAEVLDIYLSDSSGEMNDSQTVQLTVTPSAFRITAPGGSPESETSACAGPFDLELLDGQAQVAAAVLPITALLSGGGDAGKYYSDSSCENEVSSFVYNPGQSAKTFYFKGQYPESSLTLTVTDNDAVLASDTQAWAVTSDWGFLGTASTQYDQSGNLLPFRTGIKPVAARYDGIYSGWRITMSPDKKYLYVLDYDRDKVLKYDYEQNEYIGWMGRLRKENGIGSTGSNIANPSSALCISTNNNQILPGWCLGGRPIGGNPHLGGLYDPQSIVADENYVYVTNISWDTVNRYNAETGEFDGFLGTPNSTPPTGPGTGGPASCTTAANNTPMPGWCIGGSARQPSTNTSGDGRLYNPRGVAVDDNYIYVGVDGAIKKFDKTTGAYVGWVGLIRTTPTGGAAGCNITAAGQLTPGWCTGGESRIVDPRNYGGVAGGVRYGYELYIEGNSLFYIEQAYGGVVVQYDKDTGANLGLLNNLNYTWTNPLQMTSDGTNFFVADDERILKISQTGLIEGWMGKVANNAGMSDAGGTGCNSLSPNDNTPGWCLGGTHKPGLDEDSFINAHGIVYDGAGSLLVVSRQIPSIRKFNSTTGDYERSLALESISPKEWSSDRTLDAEFHGFDDDSSYNPLGVTATDDFIFVVERTASRLKKISKKTGELVGWVGGVTSTPTGGVAGCTSANGMGPSPGWCTGANFYPNWTWNDINMIDDLTDGIMYQPHGITTDGTWVYVVDYGIHRIQRFDVVTGAYGGWIGRINRSPTGGAPGCNGAPVDTFTPGWCLGGMSEQGEVNGGMDNPTGITYTGGSLYIVDADNHRIAKYNAVTGNYEGWIGRIGSNPTSGCTWGTNGNYNVSQSGWCIGGTASRGNYRNDRGGGFNFEYSSYSRSGIYSDGVNIYVAHTRNTRIDRINLDGSYGGAARSRLDQNTNVWMTDPADIASGGQNCDYPISVWADNTDIYFISMYPCSRDGDTFGVGKMNKSTGTVEGWKGAVSATYPPTGGDTGCAGATLSTPGWCTGGRVGIGFKLGQFNGTWGHIFGDNEFLYVTDYGANRLIRVPKED